MARIRTIKPEFWTSEQVMNCEMTSRLLFIGLWNFADDRGRMTLSLKKIKAQVFPSDDVDSDFIQRLIQDLTDNDLITLYDVDNVEYIQINGWKHQRIDKPQRSRYPDIHGIIEEDSKKDPRSLDVGMEGKGREGSYSAKGRI
jgi:hypothetical protein